jgi:hypothetical protein
MMACGTDRDVDRAAILNGILSGKACRQERGYYVSVAVFQTTTLPNAAQLLGFEYPYRVLLCEGWDASRFDISCPTARLNSGHHFSNLCDNCPRFRCSHFVRRARFIELSSSIACNLQDFGSRPPQMSGFDYRATYLGPHRVTDHYQVERRATGERS